MTKNKGMRNGQKDVTSLKYSNKRSFEASLLSTGIRKISIDIHRLFETTAEQINLFSEHFYQSAPHQLNRHELIRGFFAVARS
jgi:hypothetical protein